MLSRIKKLTDSLFVRMVVAVSAFYWVIDWLLPQPAVNALLTALSLCLAAGVVILYLPSGIEAVKKHDMSSRDRLVVGIILSWAARFLLSSIALITLLAGRVFTIDFNATSYFGYVFTMVLLAAVFHITAPSLTTGMPPRRNWRGVIIALCIGFFLAGLVIGIAWMKATGGS